MFFDGNSRARLPAIYTWPKHGKRMPNGGLMKLFTAMIGNDNAIPNIIIAILTCLFIFSCCRDDQIKVGMTRSEVISLLGKPNKIQRIEKK